MEMDIRDIEIGSEYFVVTDRETGRCVTVDGFIVAWKTRKQARDAANTLIHQSRLASGYTVLRQVKG